MVTRLEGVRSAEAALEKAGLAWGIRQEPIYDVDRDKIPTHKAIVRADTGDRLAVVKNSYEPVDNFTFGFFDVLCNRFGARYEFAGSVGQGQKVWLQARVGSFFAEKSDEVRTYITLLNSFDQSTSLRVLLGGVRMFCNNQLTKCIDSASLNICIRHSSSIHEKLDQAFTLMDQSLSGFRVFEKKAQFLARKSVNGAQVQRFLDIVLPNENDESSRIRNARDRTVQLFESGKGNTGRSAWHLFNGFVERLDTDGGGDQDRLEFSRQFGYRADRKGRAFQAALAL